jgi:Uma2 family endonuclease
MAAQTVDAPPYVPVLTLEDYLDLPPDEEVGLEQEIIRGRLVTVSRPGGLHQVLLGTLYVVLRRYLGRLGWHIFQLVLDADLLMDAVNTYVSPDLMVFGPEALPALADAVSRRRRIHVSVVRPLLVVEISSPDSRTRDMVAKVQDYEGTGIPHYWVFDPDARVLHELTLDSETGRYSQRTHNGGRVRPRAFARLKPALTLNIDALWPEVPDAASAAGADRG